MPFKHQGEEGERAGQTQLTSEQGFEENQETDRGGQ